MDDAFTITLFLVNGQMEPKQRKDQAWLFQPEIIIETPDLQPTFIRRKLPDGLAPTEVEDKIMSMIYRKQVEFAVGHGIAVHAELADERWDVAQRIRTEVLPRAEVLRMEPRPIENLTVDMRALAETERGNFAPLLMPLVDDYASWIAERDTEIAQNPVDLEPFETETAVVRKEWAEALKRISAGIELLDADADAARAFQFANRAMWQQRIRTEFSKRVRQGETPDLTEIDQPGERSWRPFQLAFILLNLPAMSDPTHSERSSDDPDNLAYADLLWFPTGGGKTEAYLGLTAYTMAIRRLQGEVGGLDGMAGVAVLMRYTLRLLTLQQFQRAAALIAACEIIRRDDPQMWGKRPFRIGLWVGMRSTPNWTRQSAEAIKRQHGHGWHSGSSIGGSGTPVQLTHCPWCGSEIKPGRDIVVETAEAGRGRTFQYCGDALGECEFSRFRAPDEGLPVVVVDEEIYRLLPDLLIATVDKFARMPWQGRNADALRARHRLLSIGMVISRRNLTTRDGTAAKASLPAVKSTADALAAGRPTLIIQDELHLISGPLGTLVGLYETAVDALCSWQLDGATVRPKVVASTATIRRAQQQVKNIFLRQVKIFPPTGINVEDNYFSERHDSNEAAPGRLYLGVCATGTRFKTILIRVYVAAMAAAQTLLEKYGAEHADPYMTLVGYFNSMRDLGGMRRVLDDAVSTRLKRMDQRGLSRRYVNTFNIDELTSRKSAVDIPQILDRLETRFTQMLADKSKRRRGEKRALDALLATNMISVGVDVSRLGLMVVANQPKHTAEYIQATSRIGRQYPGLVLTVYNWARPRDVSHYERFEHYHETFYQQVEALSVTPFASRALDRGLSAVLVSHVRLADEDFNENDKAGDILKAESNFAEARKTILQRVSAVHEVARPQVEQMMSDRIDLWAREASNPAAHLGYAMRKDGKTVPLLKHTTGRDWEAFTCLNSLRDVEHQ